jgi:Lipid A 3-O-deacylase (PagL)
LSLSSASLNKLMQSPRKLSNTISVVTIALAGVLLVKAPCLAADPDSVLETSRWEISGEGTVAHFGARLNDRAIQAWNLSARFSLLPFGVSHFHFLRGTLDGALEVGLEPTFERFSVRHLPQNTAGFANYEGAGLVLRYYLVHFRYEPLVPWIEAGIAPGGTDLKIGKQGNETLLTGPFMNRIKGGIGVSCFISENADVYIGLQAQHLSNAGLNGPNRNFALNTPVSFVIGGSWFFR